ncbi:response regulator [uncultured Desulfosarcina sp.]|uniref:response regulator n=1 Tax=uncultured Desulfosarcina sp. TaxID=218289 RepID=UPI0029C6C75D|nr:response regulator [uncultured Desulfosarcina sp.]
MSVISIFSGIFCSADAVVRDVMDRTGYRLITDDQVIAKTAETSGMPGNKVQRAFSARTSVFNKFTHEKECSIACLRLALATELEKGPAVVHGFSSLLIPRSVSHVLRVCIIAETPYRIEQAGVVQNLTEKDALKQIRTRDADNAAWTETLFFAEDPWDLRLYDMVLPMNRVSVAEAGVLIGENLIKDAVRRTNASIQAEKDFLLAATVEMALCRAGHDVSVTAENGAVLLTINKQVLMLARLEEELKSIAGTVTGVRSVKTKVGKNFQQAHIYRKHSLEVPSRVLLVDDEREFVQTLSERLELRDMGSAVAYDGESALTLVAEDDPEVMIIDLKMPGIDGMEILKQVKTTRPEIEVIVLTGHGSETDRKRCMHLGAFAYLQKPVDIDELSETLKRAHEKIQQLKS